MALGWNPTIANELLDAICRNAALTNLPVAAFWIQLHAVGEPGAAGTANVAGNATRKQVTFGSNAAGGTISNTAPVTWSSGEVDTSEDYLYWSAWTLAAAGVFLFSGTVTANAVTTGDQFTIPTGDLDITLPVAA
jgi:uncharacterized membrane protein YgdD (TMEM256/DUF423 family)